MSLESRYRRLLRAYPRSYRSRRGEEMVGTLLESARPDQTRPSRREAGDLLAAALRERLGLHALPRLAEGLRIAGPIGLVLATVAAAEAWFDAGSIGSTVVAGAWLLALVGGQVWSRLRALAVLAWLITLAVFATDLVGLDLRSAQLVAVPAAFGLIAAVGCLVQRPAPSTVERIAPPTAVAVLVATIPANHWIPLPVHLAFPVLLRLVPVALLAIGALSPRDRRTSAWVWAAALLAVPLPLVLQSLPSVGAFGSAAGAVSTAYLAVLLALVVALTARQRTAEPLGDTARPLAAIGSTSLGAAAGIGIALIGLGVGGLFASPLPGIARVDLLALALPVFAAVVGVFPRVRLIAVGLALVGLAAAVVTERITTLQPSVAGVLALLLIVSMAAGTERAPGWVAVSAGVAAGLTALAHVGARPVDLEWPYAIGVQGTAVPLVAGIVLVPTLVWGVRHLLRIRALRPGPVIAVVAALVWLVLRTGPVELLDTRLLGGIVIGAVVAQLVRARRPATDAPTTTATTTADELDNNAT